MKRAIWLCLMVPIGVVVVAQESVADEPADSILAGLLAAHNHERQAKALGPVTLSEKLNQAALVQAKDMAAHQVMDHKGSDGSTPVDRIKRTGYVYLNMGENVAEGQESVADVMTTWMNSPGHRANILGKFTEMGAACVKDDQGVPYWCVDFGTPMPKLVPVEAAAAVLAEWNKPAGDDAEDQPKKVSEPALGRAAMALSVMMADKDDPKLEVDPSKILSEQKISGREIRMQFLAGVPTAAEAAKSLMGDDGDLGGFTSVGVGYAIAKSGTPYWSAIFAKPARTGRVRVK
jgi:uncharacterized protein YkwD